MNKGTVSWLDLTLVSDSLVNACEWYVKSGSTVGSDHFPALTLVNINMCIQEGSTFTRWCFAKADGNQHTW